MPTSIQSIDANTSSIQVNGVEALRLSSSGGAQVSQLNGGQLTGMRNKIINGAMVIDQRNAGATVTPADGQYVVDRWMGRLTQASKYSMSRVSTSPIPGGCQFALKGTTTAAFPTLGATDWFHFQHRVEGNNMADLAWGTAQAASATLSFWVNASIAGAYSGSLLNNVADRSYVFSYTVNNANTWEYKTITIVGDTTGTWETGTNTGTHISFSMGCGTTFQKTPGSWGAGTFFAATGTTNVIGSLSATFSITGVQFERGQATPFEFRLYPFEFALCQRYYEVQTMRTVAVPPSGGTQYGSWIFKVPKRVNPTLSIGAGSSWTAVDTLSTDGLLVYQTGNVVISGCTVTAEL